MPLTLDSVLTIRELDHSQAERIVALASGELDPAAHPDMFPRTILWLKQGGSRPPEPEIIMTAIDEAMDAHGIEPIESEAAEWSRHRGHIIAIYANVGA